MNEDPGRLKTPTESEKNSSPDAWLSRLLSPLKELSKLITLAPQKSAFQWIVGVAAVLVIAMVFNVDLPKITAAAVLVPLIAVGIRVLVNPKTLQYHALTWIFVLLVLAVAVVVTAGMAHNFLLPWVKKQDQTTLVPANTGIGANSPSATSTRPQRQALILLGSQNVGKLVENELFPSDGEKNNSTESLKDIIDPIWVDLGSGDALHTAVRIFGNGQVVGASDRVGFIAMSSCGIKKGEDALAKPMGQADLTMPTEQDDLTKHENNYFLVIHISQEPLALFYRGKRVKDLLGGYHYGKEFIAELNGKKLSQKFSYDFVNLSDLAPLLGKPALTIHRYFPSGNSCTKYLFQQAYDPLLPAPKDPKEKRKPFDWSTLKGVEDLPPTPPEDDFIEIMAEAQHPLGSRKSPDRIHVAIICAGKNKKTCEKPLMEDFVLIFKITRYEADLNAFHISNPAECKVVQYYAKKLAQDYAGKEIETDREKKGCIIRRKAPNGIIELGDPPLRVAGYP